MPHPESLNKSGRPEYHVKQLRHLLEDFSDEIPEEWMSGTKGAQYKVKMKWWQPLIDTLDLANTEAIIDQALKEEVEAFISKCEKSNMGHKKTERENIEKANALLKKVIENLQRSI